MSGVENYYTFEFVTDSNNNRKCNFGETSLIPMFFFISRFAKKVLQLFFASPIESEK